MIEQRYKNGGGVITWDSEDWKAGLGPQGIFTSGVTLKQNTPSGWAYLSNMDPFRAYGAFYPGYNAGSTYTNSLSLAGTVVAGQFVNNTYYYGVDNGGKVQFIDSISKSIYTTSPFPHTITGTSPVGQDGLIYRHKSGGSYVNSFFFSYYNNTNWNVGVYENFATNGLSGSFTDAYMSTTPATPLDIASASPADGRDVDQKTAPHPLEIGADGILYIGSGRYLHCYDGNTGTNGTFSSRVLTLPQGFQIVALKKYQDQLLIAGNYYSNVAAGPDGTGAAQLYVWNYIDLDITQMIPLEDAYVTALFLWKGTPTVITNGIVERNGANKIKILSGNTVQKVTDFDGVIPIQRGIIVANDMLYINSGGKVLTYGNKFEPGDQLNNIASFLYTGTSGVLLYNYALGVIVGSAANNASYCLNSFDSGYSGAVARGFYYEPQFPVGYIGKVKSVTIQFYEKLDSNASNGNVILTLLTEHGNNSVNILTNLAAVPLPLKKRYSLGAAGETLPYFSNLALQFVYATGSTGTPVVSKITVEYEDAVMPPNT